jgi:hypothetical protein
MNRTTERSRASRWHGALGIRRAVRLLHVTRGAAAVGRSFRIESSSRPHAAAVAGPDQTPVVTSPSGVSLLRPAGWSHISLCEVRCCRRGAWFLSVRLGAHTRVIKTSRWSSTCTVPTPPGSSPTTPAARRSQHARAEAPAPDPPGRRDFRSRRRCRRLLDRGRRYSPRKDHPLGPTRRYLRHQDRRRVLRAVGCSSAGALPEQVTAGHPALRVPRHPDQRRAPRRQPTPVPRRARQRPYRRLRWRYGYIPGTKGSVEEFQRLSRRSLYEP